MPTKEGLELICTQHLVKDDSAPFLHHRQRETQTETEDIVHTFMNHFHLLFPSTANSSNQLPIVPASFKLSVIEDDVPKRFITLDEKGKCSRHEISKASLNGSPNHTS